MLQSKLVTLNKATNKGMTVQMEDKMEVTGHWWKPGGEDNKIKGNLAIFADGDGRLVLEGSETELTAIHGLSESDNTPVTVISLLFRQLSLSSTPKSTFSFRTAFLGAHLAPDNDALFNQVSFSFDGLDCWINKIHTAGTNSSAAQRVSLDYSLYEKDEYDFGNGITLTIYQGKKWETSPLNFMHLAYPIPVSLQDIQGDIYKIRNLLVLLCDQPINLYFLQVVHQHIPVDVYSHALGRNENPRNYKLLYGYHDISSRFQQVLSKWLADYENLKPSIYMHVGAIGVPHALLESRFIFLMQGLEVFHRHTRNKTLMEQTEYDSIREALLEACPGEHQEWLSDILKHKNETPFKARLKELFQEFQHFGSNKDISKLIHAVVSHRNYLMHGGENGGIIKDGRGLLWRMQRLEVLMKFCFLKELGFSEVEIASVANGNRNIQFQLTTKFE